MYSSSHEPYRYLTDRDAWRRRGLNEANFTDLIDVSESNHNTRLQSTSIRTVDGRGSALPAPDEPEIRAYFTGVGLFSYFSESGFGQPLLFQYRILWQLLLSSTQGRLAFVSSSVIFLSRRRHYTDWCRIGTTLCTALPYTR